MLKDKLQIIRLLRGFHWRLIVKKDHATLRCCQREISSALKQVNKILLKSLRGITLFSHCRKQHYLAQVL